MILILNGCTCEDAHQVLRASSRWVFLVMVVPDLEELLVNVQWCRSSCLFFYWVAKEVLW